MVVLPIQCCPTGAREAVTLGTAGLSWTLSMMMDLKVSLVTLFYLNIISGFDTILSPPSRSDPATPKKWNVG